MRGTLPLIRDGADDFAGDCTRAGGLKELHKICRTLPVPVRDNSNQDFLQDEAGFAVNDEITNSFIFDDLR